MAANGEQETVTTAIGYRERPRRRSSLLCAQLQCYLIPQGFAYRAAGMSRLPCRVPGFPRNRRDQVRYEIPQWPLQKSLRCTVHSIATCQADTQPDSQVFAFQKRSTCTQLGYPHEALLARVTDRLCHGGERNKVSTIPRTDRSHTLRREIPTLQRR